MFCRTNIAALTLDNAKLTAEVNLNTRLFYNFSRDTELRISALIRQLAPSARRLAHIVVAICVEAFKHICPIVALVNIISGRELVTSSFRTLLSTLLNLGPSGPG